MSPKFFAAPPLEENWGRADEVKLICTSPEQMRVESERILLTLDLVKRDWVSVWLHPEWSQARNPELLRAIVEAVKSNPRLRAGIQMHKHYRADTFDPGTRPDVPLGGKTPNPIIALEALPVIPLRSGKTVEAGTMEIAVQTLLLGIGEDPAREGLRDTPRRVVKSLRELTSGSHEDIAAILGTTFEETHRRAITVGPIRFSSTCEHHLLPFTGEAWISYLPEGRVVGLSKIPRLVEAVSRRLQLQERFTDQIAGALQEHLKPRGVAVWVRAHHSCMGCRGVRQLDTQMITRAYSGTFETDVDAVRGFKAEVLRLSRP